jgi:predicted aspartyl protease
MRNRILASLPVLAALASSVTLSAGSAAPLPFTLTGTGQILVPAMINGKGPYLFVLDTGANRSAISETLAARLALEPVAVTELVTATGSAMRSVVKVQSIALGDHGAGDLLVTTLPAERIQSINTKAEGLIGQDVLINAHFTLDYRRKKVLWHSGGHASGSGIRLEARQAEGRVVIELPQSSKTGDVARMIPDSGASALVLFQKGGATVVPTTAVGATAQASTVSGEGTVHVMAVQKLRIGGHTIFDHPALVMAGAEAGEIDGLLPLSWFSSVTFNAREGYVIVNR